MSRQSKGISRKERNKLHDSRHGIQNWICKQNPNNRTKETTLIPKQRHIITCLWIQAGRDAVCERRIRFQPQSPQRDSLSTDPELKNSSFLFSKTRCRGSGFGRVKQILELERGQSKNSSARQPRGVDWRWWPPQLAPRLDRDND